MNTPDEAILIAFISALVEGVRLLGRRGTNEDDLYASIAKLATRKSFDMIVAELIEQKTFKRDATNHLVYCGPCMIEEG